MIAYGRDVAKIEEEDFDMPRLSECIRTHGEHHLKKISHDIRQILAVPG